MTLRRGLLIACTFGLAYAVPRVLRQVGEWWQDERAVYVTEDALARACAEQRQVDEDVVDEATLQRIRARWESHRFLRGRRRA
jgi:reverse gyrase